ncbi:2-keto-4-pentenoate hydratase [Devosia lucknowensis]|uniref:2-keto-4-pentenoate hydratase n=1 Tax=Devosia lucknowensis TaxID=1096929 RepID=A0A1Y6G6B3_9HYPH|nr:fumarylacetoacetate hydrolase family protein [Devosia lucknowensis]SMQ85314.1 2-keto-4-pentenoate hydratase [Devosia lucknowensis]
MKTLADLATALLEAHDGGPLVGPVAEELVPADLDVVYAVQNEIISQIGAVGGWKVAAGLGHPPLCSPIPAKRFFGSGDRIDAEHHRIFLAEIEVAVRLGADLPAGATIDDVEAAIASIHPAIELVGNPFVDRAATPRNLQLADLQSNGAVVVGNEVDRGITAALDTLAVVLELDGKAVHSVEKGASWTDTLTAIAWLATHAHQRGLPLRAGQVIITGARALLKLDGATDVAGILGDHGRVDCRL